MGAVVAEKTWQVSPNNYVAGGSEHAHAQQIMFAIVNSLVSFTNPMTVAGSSDSSAAGMDSVNRWVASTNIVWGTGAHSWIVLEFAGGEQWCIDCVYANTQCEDCEFWVSPSGAFTGGSTTARPTATDQQQFWMRLDTTNVQDLWWTGYLTYGSNAGYDVQVHVWLSNDVTIARYAIHCVNKCFAFVDIGQFTDARTNAENTFYWGGIAGSYTGVPTSSTVDVLDGTSDITDYNHINSADSGGLYSMRVLTLGTGGTLWPDLANANVAEQVDNEMMVTPMILWSDTDGWRGFKGRLFDIWFNQVQMVNAGDTSPNDGAHRDFVHMGAIMLPWTGDSTVMATT